MIVGHFDIKKNIIKNDGFYNGLIITFTSTKLCHDILLMLIKEYHVNMFRYSTEFGTYQLIILTK